MTLLPVGSGPENWCPVLYLPDFCHLDEILIVPCGWLDWVVCSVACLAVGMQGRPHCARVDKETLYYHFLFVRKVLHTALFTVPLCPYPPNNIIPFSLASGLCSISQNICVLVCLYRIDVGLDLHRFWFLLILYQKYAKITLYRN